MWQLAENCASLALGNWSASLDLARPDAGLRSIEVNGVRWIDSALLCVQLPTSANPADSALAEAYVRGCDLVATYAALPPFSIQPQIYWRLRQQPELGALGVELILSVHTSELYSEPQMPVHSLLSGVTAITAWKRGGASRTIAPADLPVVLRPDAGEEGLLTFESRTLGGYVYVEMTHPSDFHSVTIESASRGGIRVVTENFEERLEKGVIRRSRVCGWFLPAANWRSAVGSLFAAFCDEPVPLTA